MYTPISFHLILLDQEKYSTVSKICAKDDRIMPFAAVFKSPDESLSSIACFWKQIQSNEQFELYMKSHTIFMAYKYVISYKFLHLWMKQASAAHRDRGSCLILLLLISTHYNEYAWFGNIPAAKKPYKAQRPLLAYSILNTSSQHMFLWVFHDPYCLNC